MILTKDIRLQLDSQNDLYGNITYKYHKGGSIQTKRRYQTKTSLNQNIIKTKTKYDLSKTQNLRKYSFLTSEDQTALNLDKYLHTNRFHIITPDMKYRMRVILKQVQRKDNRSPDQRYLSFNPYKKSDKQKIYDYFILCASECPEQNLSENYLNEYGEACFQHFDYTVLNQKQIDADFVVCSFVGNNTFEVDSPYRTLQHVPSSRESLSNENSKENSDQNSDEEPDEELDGEQPLVMFKHQIEEIIQN